MTQSSSPLPPYLKQKSVWLGIFGALVVLAAIGGLITAHNYYQTRFFPRTTISGTPVSNLTLPQAIEKLTSAAPPLSEHVITLEHEGVSLASSSAELGYHWNIQPTAHMIFEATHASGLYNQVRHFIRQLIAPATYTLTALHDEARVLALIEEFATQIDSPGEPATAALGTSGNPASLTISPGVTGFTVEVTQTADVIFSNTQDGIYTTTVVTTPTPHTLSGDQQLAAARERAATLVGSTLSFTSDSGTTRLTDTELVQFLQFPTGFAETQITDLAGSLTKKFSRSPQDAVFEYDPETLVVTSFVPDKPGTQLDEASFRNQLLSALDSLEKTPADNEKNLSLPLPLHITPADKTLANTNKLGIVERIGFGESEYDHSIPSRVHNVSHTTQKITNTIIKPGEEFSFNQTLGEVSRATGFQPAYVIRNGRTELGDGGGVCQVSTTLFRAALNAGLPITRRLQHSYRVSYYELNAKPGIDATVYAGNIDLRFKNDTDHHVLIHGVADSEDLYMYIELYGTSDGRTAEIVNHETWDYVPPLPTVNIPDPTLAPGQRRQIDWAVAGIKARFTNVVKDKDGNIIREDEYYSNYRPWSAKYLVGTAEQT